jgi:hypothetical protein
MPKYIDAEDVLETIRLGIWYLCENDEGGAGTLDFVKDSIAAIPAADVAPVVHAEWQEFDDPETNAWECSACRHVYVLIGDTPVENYYLHCPNCGARMDGGAK